MRGEIKFDKENEKTVKPSTLFQLFMFASFRDKLLIIIGLTCASIYGLRLLVLTSMLSSLFMQMSLFDVTLTFEKLQLEMEITEEHINVTDQFRHNITSMFGTSSLMFIVSNVFDKFCLALGISTFALWIAYYGMTMTLDAAARHQTNRTLSLYLKTLMRQDMVWFDGNQTGKLVSQTSDDFQKYEDAIGVKLGLLIMCISGYTLPGIYCMLLDWKLTLVTFCFTPLYIVTFKIIATSRTFYSRRESNEYAKAGSIAEEVFSAIKTVVSFGAEFNEIQRYSGRLVNDTKAGFMKAIFASLGMTLFYVTFCSGFVISTYVGYYLVTNNLQVGLKADAMYSMVTIIFCINSSGYRLSEAFGHIDAIAHAKASFGRILNLIKQESTIALVDDNVVILHQKIDKIAFRNVCFNYASRPDIKILNNFNLDVKSGETIAIVGESGSGKSTLINLLLRFYDTTAGSVLLNNTDIRILSPRWLRKQIGLVGQEPVLFPTTIAENIAYGQPGVTRVQVEQAAKLANAHTFIEELPLKYETLVGDRGAQLSGGQKQRIAIARALIRNPQILLLDEATSALDSRSEAIVQDALEKASRGRTTFIIAHRLSTIRNANRIVVVSFGRIVETGTHEQLINLGGLYHTFATKQNVDIKETDKNDDIIKEVSEISDKISDKVRYPTFNVEKKTLFNEELKKSSSSAAILNLFRLGYLNSFLLICGIIGSIVFGAVYVMFCIESMPSMFLIFAAQNEDTSSRAMIRYAIFMSFCAAVFISTIILQMGFLGIVSARIGKTLRERTFSAIIRQEMAFFDDSKNSVGSLCLMLSLDVNNVKNAVGVYFGIMLTTISQMLVSTGIMFAFNYRFGVVQVALLIITTSGAIGYHIMQRKKHEEKAVALRFSNEILRQIVTNIRTVISLSLESEFHDKLINYHRTKTFSKWKDYLLSFLGVVIEGSSQIGVILFGLIGLTMFLRNEVSLMMIFRCFGIVFITNSVARSISVIPNFVASMNSLQNLFDMIDSKPKTKNNIEPEVSRPIINYQTSAETERESELIKFKDITFSYPTRPDIVTLKGFNLNIKTGQTIALVGGSGSGKSTCVQLLERFYQPDAGSIVLGGFNIGSLDPRSVRREFALVQQEPSLFDRTVADNIAYGDLSRTVTMEEIVEAATIAHAHEFISELPMGYQTRVGERGTQISGGQKQRIAIARALVRKSKIILLDEATSALDTETEKNVQSSLKAHQKNTTFIIVAHRLSTIVDADKIVVIDKGRIVETGTHVELMTRQGHYCGLQQAVDINH